MPENRKPTGENGGLNETLTITSDGNTSIIAKSGSEVNFYDLPHWQHAIALENYRDITCEFREAVRNNPALLKGMTAIKRAVDVLCDEANEHFKKKERHREFDELLRRDREGRQ